MSYMFGSRRISSVKLAFKSPYHKRFCFLVYKVNRGRRKRFWNFESLRSRGHMRKQRLKTLNACISKMAEPTAEWLAPLESAWNFTSETIIYTTPMSAIEGNNRSQTNFVVGAIGAGAAERNGGRCSLLPPGRKCRGPRKKSFPT